MKNRITKIFGVVSILFLLITVYFYSQPAIILKQLEVEKNIPIKVKPNKLGYIEILVPYKFEVTNNRFSRLTLRSIINKKNAFFDDYLFFDQSGSPLLGPSKRQEKDSLLNKKEFINYLSLKHNRTLFPFIKKEIYFYGSLIVKNEQNPEQRKELYNNFRTFQSKKLFNKSPVDVTHLKRTIDAFYKNEENQNMAFSFIPKGKENGFSKYIVKYNLKSGNQELINIYATIRNMTHEELLEYVKKRTYE
ncbi:MAG: hypothetical protein ACK5NB_00020 [Flavobacteriaceae bacterium]